MTATSDHTRQTRWLLASQAASIIGSAIVQFAIVWHITLTTQAVSAVTLALVFTFVPVLIISPLAGVWADRYNRAWLVASSDALVALTAVAVMVALSLGWDSLGPLFVALAVRGVGGAVQQPALNALVGQIVPAERLTRTNAILGIFQALSSVLSPVVAGALIPLLPLSQILLVDVATAAVAVGIVLAFVRVDKPPRTSPIAHPFAEIIAGFRYYTTHPQLLRILGVAATINLAIAPSIALENLLIAQRFGPDPHLLAVNEVAFGVSMLLGGALMTRWKGFQRPVYTIVTAIALMVISILGVAWSPSFPVFIAFSCTCGLAVPIVNAPVMAAMQFLCRPDYLGRLMSALGIVFSAAIPLGAVLAAPLATATSIPIVLTASALLGLAAGVATLCSRYLRDLPRPHEKDAETHP